MSIINNIIGIVKLTEDQIAALPVTEEDKRSNEAFAKLNAIIQYYNDGWTPSPNDRGFMVCSKKQLSIWGDDPDTSDSFSGYCTRCGPRLVIKDRQLCEFIADNYWHLYKQLWKEE